MENRNGVERDPGCTDQWIADRLAALRPNAEWQPNHSRAFARLQELCEAQRRRGRNWAWLRLAAAAAGLPLMAFPVTRAIAQRCVSACVQESNRLRDALLGSAPASTYVKPENRKMAPDFAVLDVSGNELHLTNFRGKLVLLNFWATWCEPCKAEIPMLNTLQQEFRGRDFTVFGVSLDRDGWNAVTPYAERVHFEYPVMVGVSEIASRYDGLNAMPTTLLLDRSGRIAALHVGLCNKREYEADINAVLKEQ